MDKSLVIAQTIMDVIEPIEATHAEKWTALQVATLLQSRPPERSLTDEIYKANLTSEAETLVSSEVNVNA